MSGSAGVQRVLMQPDPAGWPERVREAWSRRPDGTSAFRSELGLPSDCPIIMTGHQPGFWHPGILAKYIAADRLAKVVGGAAAAVIVDHDAKRPTTIDVPMQLQDGRWGETEFDVLAEPTAPGPFQVQRTAALAALRGEAGPIEVRTAMANAKRLGRYFACEQFSAGAMLETTFGLQLLARMVTDSKAMARAYNDAVRTHNAGIAPLAIDDARIELPLWWIAPSGERRRAWAGESLDAMPGWRLAPRALLLTSILRMAGCELFVHGIGGGVYDRASSAWIGAWLGRSLAPMVVVSADVTMPIEFTGTRLEEIERTVWLAHHARHDPSAIGDTAGAEAKRAMLHKLASTNDRAERRRLYEELHAMLAAHRSRHGDALFAIERAATEQRAQAGQARIAQRRDWPAILYPVAAMDDLAARIEQALRPSDV